MIDDDSPLYEKCKSQALTRCDLTQSREWRCGVVPRSNVREICFLCPKILAENECH